MQTIVNAFAPCLSALCLTFGFCQLVGTTSIESCMILVLFLHLDRVWLSCRGWLSLERLFDIFRVSSTIWPTLTQGSSYLTAAVTLLVLYSLAQLCSDWNRIRWLWRDSPDCKWHDRRGTRAVMVGLTVTVKLLIISTTVGQRPWFDRVVLMRLHVSM